jgi:predicted nuclease of predicted toxin-antitoxin system
MTSFLIDAQLPPALARWLSDQGHPSEHVFDFGGDGTTDSQVWARAIRNRSVIVTKDEDFALRAMRQGDGPQIVWLRVGNSRRAALLEWMSRLLPAILHALEQGERVVEIT